MTKNKQTAIWVAVAVGMIIVGAGTFVHAGNNKKIASKTLAPKIAQSTTAPALTVITPSTGSVLDTTTPDTVVATTSTPPTTSPAYKRKSASKASALNYGEMVNKYANTRIQFNDLCQGIPGQDAMANGITIMLDNRSDAAIKITILGKKYMVSAYNYILITLNQKNLPAQVSINCNGQMNASVVTLE